MFHILGLAIALVVIWLLKVGDNLDYYHEDEPLSQRVQRRLRKKRGN